MVTASKDTPRYRGFSVVKQCFDSMCTRFPIEYCTTIFALLISWHSSNGKDVIDGQNHKTASGSESLLNSYWYVFNPAQCKGIRDRLLLIPIHYA